MKKLSAKIKKTSFSFYKNENIYERSTIHSFASRHNTIFFPQKYRSVNNVYKEEKKLFGKILPSTIVKPESRRPRVTLASGSWYTNPRFRFDLVTTLNSSNLIR